MKYIDRVNGMGGAMKAIEAGFMQREIADASYRYQVAVDAGEEIVVGVNKFASGDHAIPEVLEIGPAIEVKQVARTAKLKRERDNPAVTRALEGVRATAAGDGNIMPVLIEAVKAYATVGEISDVLRQVFGEFREIRTVI